MKLLYDELKHLQERAAPIQTKLEKESAELNRLQTSKNHTIRAFDVQQQKAVVQKIQARLEPPGNASSN